MEHNVNSKDHYNNNNNNNEGDLFGMSHATLNATPLKKRPVHLPTSLASPAEAAARADALSPMSSSEVMMGQDGTTVQQQYYCKYCDTSWPYTHFRNAQQFGAHCSNCSRKRKVKDPQDLTIRERNKRIRRSRSHPPQRKTLPRRMLQPNSFGGYLEEEEHDVDDDDDDDDDDEDDDDEATANYELEGPTKPLLTCLDALRSQNIVMGERDHGQSPDKHRVSPSAATGDGVWALKKAAIRDWTAQRGPSSRTAPNSKPRLTRTSRSAHHHAPHLPQLRTIHHGKRAVIKHEDDAREDEEHQVYDDELDIDSSAESKDSSPKNGSSAETAPESGPIGDLLVAVEKELAAEKEKRELADVRAQVLDLKQEINVHWGQGVDELRERAVDLMKELRVETMSSLDSLKSDLSHDFAARQARRKTRLHDVRIQMHAIQRILDSARQDRDNPPLLHTFRTNYDSALKQLDDVKAHLSKELSAREQSMQEEFSDARASCSLQLRQVKQRMTEELNDREVRMQKDLDGIQVTMHSMCSRIATDYAPGEEDDKPGAQEKKEDDDKEEEEEKIVAASAESGPGVASTHDGCDTHALDRSRPTVNK